MKTITLTQTEAQNLFKFLAWSYNSTIERIEQSEKEIGMEDLIKKDKEELKEILNLYKKLL